MDSNFILAGLIGAIVNLIGLIGLLVKAWVDSRRNGKALEQCQQCAIDHLEIKSRQEAIKTALAESQKTLDERQPVFNKMNEMLIQMKTELENKK